MGILSKVQDKINIMQSYIDGKVIEYKPKNSAGNTWGFTLNPCWNFDEYEYRVKPEEKIIQFVKTTNGGIVNVHAIEFQDLNEYNKYIENFGVQCSNYSLLGCLTLAEGQVLNIQKLIEVYSVALQGEEMHLGYSSKGD